MENEFVVNRLRDAVNALLPSRGYQVVHADTVDERGIDVAFLYDPTSAKGSRRRLAASA